jgi:GNAT superfamily N-acetyltransferase
MPSSLSFRPAAPDDAELIAAAVARGFEGYREFAPAGWERPLVEREAELVRVALADSGSWCAIAEAGGVMAGHSFFAPAAAGARASEEPGLAHLRGLFVEPEWWGSGLARELHSMAIGEAARRGWHAMRLFTPEGNARARRFYEREGWTRTGATFELANGLPTVEYRRALG